MLKKVNGLLKSKILYMKDLEPLERAGPKYLGNSKRFGRKTTLKTIFILP